jgi:hypothetical protein
MVVVFGALQRWRPVEAVTDKAAVRVDVIYTLIHRLGLFRVALFFTLDPLWDGLVGQLRVAGLPAWSVDQIWPGVTDLALVSFVIYLVLFDGVNYALHRAQHRFDWWWQLHALHHSQRQLTMWSDNRNHLLDDVLRDSAFVLVGLLVGIAPGQFVAVVAFTQLMESLSHANVRCPSARCWSVCWSARVTTVCTTPSAWGTNPPGPAAWAATTWPCCSRCGTCSSAPRASPTATKPTGVRDQLRRPGLRPWFLGAAVAGTGASVGSARRLSASRGPGRGRSTMLLPDG